MADLPKDRVTHGAAPFSTVGVDFFGPFMVKRARSELKRYGCLFTCLTTRAIHIEVCHSLETNSFINALQRFISRRGEPTEIRSDNGTNLVGAQRELQRAGTRLASTQNPGLPAPTRSRVEIQSTSCVSYGRCMGATNTERPHHSEWSPSPTTH